MAMERKTLRKGWLQDKSVIDNFTNPCREVTSEVMSHDVIDDISMVNVCVCLHCVSVTTMSSNYNLAPAVKI